MVHSVQAGSVSFGDDQLSLISGPCVIESESVIMQAAEEIKKIADDLKIPVVFKSSFTKDNRGTATGYKGPGPEEGLAMLQKVKEQFGVPVLSDVHSLEDIALSKDVLDVIQIPAYLCQQTGLVTAAGATGKCVNIKKGQFLAPEGIVSPIGKVESTGNRNILVTERGSCFGYNRLVSDLRCIPIMQAAGYPVVYDATHIIRIYGVRSNDPRGGEREYVPHLVRAAVAAGTNALFIESHPNVDQAQCDAVSQWPLPKLRALLEEAVAFYETARRFPLEPVPLPE